MIVLLISLFCFSCASEATFLVAEDFCLTNESKGFSVNNPIGDYVEQHERKFVPKPGVVVLEDYLDYSTESTEDYITDARWDKFPEILTKSSQSVQEYVKVWDVQESKFILSFSIRGKDNGHVFLCDNFESPASSNCYWMLIGMNKNMMTGFRKCGNGDISYVLKFPGAPCKYLLSKIQHDKTGILDENLWKHFKIEVGNDSILLFNEDRLLLNYSFDGNPFSVKHIFFHAKFQHVLWKIHRINFMRISQRGEKKIGTFQSHPNQRICISLLMKMCKACRIKATIIESNQRILIKEFNAIFEETWKELKMVYETASSEVQKFDLYFQFYSVDFAKEVFWDLSDLRGCSVEEFRVLSGAVQACQLSDKNLVSLKNTKTTLKGHSKCKLEEFGHEQCFSCKEFLATEKYCSAFKYCDQNNCFCSAGHTKENCKSECPYGFYGHFCEGFCKNCYSNDCDSLGRCQSLCLNGYQGENCNIPPFLAFLNSVEVIKSNLNSCIVKMTDFTTISNLNTTYFYKIQYRVKGTKPWRYNNDNQFIIGVSMEILIDNLKPDTSYEMRPVIVPQNTSYSEDLPSTICHTSCLNFNSNQLSSTSWNTSLQLAFIEKLPNNCNEDHYEMIAPKKQNDWTFLSQLESATEYEVVLKHKYLQENVSKIIATEEGEPDPVRALYCNCSASCLCSWKEPLVKNGRVEYFYELTFMTRIFCPDYWKSKIIENGTTSQTSIELNNLRDGSSYKISVFAKTKWGYSMENAFSFTSKDSGKVEEMELPEMSFFPDLDTLKLSWNLDHIIDKFKMVLLVKCLSPWCSNHKPTSQKLDFKCLNMTWKQDLMYFVEYSFQVELCRGSHCLNNTLTAKTKPGAPNEVRSLSVADLSTKNLITLRWMVPYPPTGLLDKYFLQNDGKAIDNFTLSECVLWPSFVCAQFQVPSSYIIQYYFTVRASNVQPRRKNSGKSISFYRNSLTSAPYNFEIQPQTDRFDLQWKHPNFTKNLYKFTAKINGSFLFDYYLNETSYQSHYSKELNGSSHYSCSKATITLSSNEQVEQSELLEIPPLKPFLKYNFKASQKTILLKMELETSLNQLNCWVFLGTTINGSFQANCEKLAQENGEFDVVLGSNKTEFSRFFNQTLFNEELTSGTTYNVTVRLNCFCLNGPKGTSNVMFYSMVMTQEDSLNLLWLILIPLVFVGLVLSFFLFRVKERYPDLLRDAVLGIVQRDERGSEEMVLTNKISAEKTKKCSEEHEFSVPVKVQRLEQYIRECLISGELTRQHEMFPRGQTQAWNYGSNAANKHKNRYNNLIAYDHSRVVLSKINNQDYSDYINANYIDGYNMEKVYIATQGPKKSTLNDFWRMIWQENSLYIVMLANVMENNKRKVEKYWPDINETINFGDVKVQFVSDEVFANFVFRKFTVSCQGATRTVKQYHYTTWPDHGVPLYPQSLVPFLEKLLEIPYKTLSPITVHCSAGIGRTGTIILCDICLRMAAIEGTIDFVGTLERLRQQRPNMVDNPTQFKLAHFVVLDCLMGLKTNISCEDMFQDKILELLESKSIEQQIDYLFKIEWQDTACSDLPLEEVLSAANLNKNRFPSILPALSRIYLTQYPIEDESSTYINAISVDGFCSPDKFVVTQQPLPETLKDFWRLIFETGSLVVVSLNELDEEDVTSCKFWPDLNDSMQPVDYLTVTCVKTVSCTNYQLITVHLTRNQEDCSQIVDIIQLKNWRNKELIPQLSAKDFVAFYTEIESISRKSDPIIITCYDGTTASGLYLALVFVIERIKLEHECDVCMAVRYIRHNRRQFVGEKEQFEFLYKAALEYVQGFQDYSNFN